MSEALKELQSKAAKLTSELLEVKTLIRDELLKQYKKQFGIYIGCIVRYENVDFKIESIDTRYSSKDKPWISGFKRNKDGEFSCRKLNAYNGWELVTNE